MDRSRPGEPVPRCADVEDKEIGRAFMRQTKHAYLSLSDERAGVPQPPLEWPVPPCSRRISLPEPVAAQADIGLVATIAGRRSVRHYSTRPLHLAELSFLLKYTQGVQQVTDRPSTLRPVPSAGARHALETYLLVNRVDSLAPGLYRFAALDNQLVECDLSPETAAGIAQACRGSQPLCATSAVTFIWVAVAERMTWRYSERGYRFLHLDAGHVCQNLYLLVAAIGAGTCAIGGYNDDDLNTLLHLDGESRFVIYLATVGKV